MRKRVTGVVVAGVVLVAGAAMAQTTGVDPGQESRSIIPVTGPSMVPSLAEPAKREAVLAVGQGEVVTEGARKGTAGRPTAATVSRQGSRTVKAVHKPATQVTVKKGTAARHVAKAGQPARTRHAAAERHRPPVRHATVSRPTPVAKNPTAKNAGPTHAVLPRV